MFGEAAYPSAATYDLYDNIAACAPIADTLAQQRSIGDECITALRNTLSRAAPSPIRTQLQTLLGQAGQATLSGDGQADPNQRAADYQSAVATLATMAQVAGEVVPSWDGHSWVPLSTRDIADIKKFAAYGTAALSQTGLS
jgi:hypothetical protein